MIGLRRLLVVLVVLVCAALATAAVAKTRNGITPKAPKKGASVAAGTRVTFKGRYSGDGEIWVRVAKSRKVNRFGVIKPTKDTLQLPAKRKGSRWTLKAPLYDYPEFWLNAPGTYYWQAHRVPTVCKQKDCLIEGPIVRFTVR